MSVTYTDESAAMLARDTEQLKNRLERAEELLERVLWNVEQAHTRPADAVAAQRTPLMREIRAHLDETRAIIRTHR